MNVVELIAFLEDALVQGLDPETTVVVAADGDWKIIESAVDPAKTNGDFIWLTLYPGEFADSRMTRGHEEGPEDEVRSTWGLEPEDVGRF